MKKPYYIVGGRRKFKDKGAAIAFSKLLHESSGVYAAVELVEDASDFAAYKVATDGSQFRYDYVRNLTSEQARDEKRFPLGPQRDERGSFVWSYGCNQGEKL